MKLGFTFLVSIIFKIIELDLHNGIEVSLRPIEKRKKKENFPIRSFRTVFLNTLFYVFVKIYSVSFFIQ
jgi:hypothetical protein